MVCRSHSKQSSLSPRSSFSVGGSIEEDGQGPEESRVTLLGPQNVGKSTLIQKFLSTESEGEGPGDRNLIIFSPPPCAESGGRLAVMLEGIESVLIFTELNSQQLQPETITENDCVIVVFSLTDRESLEDVKIVLERLWQSGVVGCLPVILVGNKTDLVRTRQVPADGERYSDMFDL